MKTSDPISSLRQLLKLPDNPLDKFHDLTKIKGFFIKSAKSQPRNWKAVLFKEYPRLNRIFLLQPHFEEQISLEAILFSRHSSTQFSNQKLSIEQISNLLFFTSGVRKNNKSNTANRFYPSAGSRYPLEVYVLAINCEFPKGVYHYNLRQHSLEVLNEFKKTALDKYFNQDWIYDAGCIVLISAIFKRNTIKYGPRGYRHVLQESGHLAQNFYLLCSALDLSVCGVGGYDDDKLNRLLDIDGLNETVIYTLAIGNPKDA